MQITAVMNFKIVRFRPKCYNNAHFHASFISLSRTNIAQNRILRTGSASFLPEEAFRCTNPFHPMSYCVYERFAYLSR